MPTSARPRAPPPPKRGSAGRGRTPLQVVQAVDCADWLPNDLLIKLDRCLMAHGAEGRTPFLDTKVAELALRLPDALKIHRGLGKWLLRRWVAERVPQALWHRRHIERAGSPPDTLAALAEAG